LIDYGHKPFFKFFLPSGAPIALAPLLVVIELISYIFRPISLGVRLFANLTQFIGDYSWI
jgi:F0F1-type ATP synthase membrane subunit a